MSDGYMSRQRDIIISTYRYFFADIFWKKNQSTRSELLDVQVLAFDVITDLNYGV